MIDEGSDKTSKYRIVSERGGWSIQHDQARLGPFADPAEAIDQACRAARSDAAGGRVAIVTTETVPQELHCYTPSLDAERSAPPRPQPLLRLIANR